jgi:hypothetical protein
MTKSNAAGPDIVLRASVSKREEEVFGECDGCAILVVRTAMQRDLEVR